MTYSITSVGNDTNIKNDKVHVTNTSLDPLFIRSDGQAVPIVYDSIEPIPVTSTSSGPEEVKVINTSTDAIPVNVENQITLPDTYTVSSNDTFNVLVKNEGTLQKIPVSISSSSGNPIFVKDNGDFNVKQIIANVNVNPVEITTIDSPVTIKTVNPISVKIYNETDIDLSDYIEDVYKISVRFPTSSNPSNQIKQITFNNPLLKAYIKIDNFKSNNNGAGMWTFISRTLLHPAGNWTSLTPIEKPYDMTLVGNGTIYANFVCISNIYQENNDLVELRTHPLVDNYIKGLEFDFRSMPTMGYINPSLETINTFHLHIYYIENS